MKRQNMQKKYFIGCAIFIIHNETPEHAKEIFHRLCDSQNWELGNPKTDFYNSLSKNFLGINNFAYRG